jgi:four helix bundle protein
MARGSDSDAVDGSAVASFGVERLDAYRVALEFQGLIPQLLPPKGHAHLRDQLERASASVVLNLAEGAGRRALNEKVHFYAIARGSAAESAAIMLTRLTDVTQDPRPRERGRGRERP